MQNSCLFGFLVSLHFLSLKAVIAWDNDELELFDLVEELNQNFYEILGVDQVLPYNWYWR